MSNDQAALTGAMAVEKIRLREVLIRYCFILTEVITNAPVDAQALPKVPIYISISSSSSSFAAIPNPEGPIVPRA